MLCCLCADAWMANLSMEAYERTSKLSHSANHMPQYEDATLIVECQRAEAQLVLLSDTQH